MKADINSQTNTKMETCRHNYAIGDDSFIFADPNIQKKIRGDLDL